MQKYLQPKVNDLSQKAEMWNINQMYWKEMLSLFLETWNQYSVQR